jgi:taurine dioxygenase
MIQPQFVWTHDWQLGDVVMWDNRPTMHRRDPFPASERRLLKRTQIFNDEIPYEDEQSEHLLVK